ncbi:MerR family transcriptional regulator [Effusibacillus pohliae]|uniref:hypothetical protein n=1 Tax=Effusibacillus pohliae TaxID=232270 RepID=UPI00037A4C37|nr:hypothetical protein [Effusibacillus pohliae]
MSPIYCTIKELSDLFRIDYSTMLRILHRNVADHPEIRRFARYDLKSVADLHRTTAEPLKVDLDSYFLTLHEVREILAAELAPMVYTTVLRQAAKGEIPAVKFWDTYRLPETMLRRWLKEGRIRKHKR